ncbi:MAG: hypothetical protein KAT43_03340 [Nanoarchaeota archaeon]|nr:hypothetical protein [Nanoarchaeota archaeon]
MLSKTGYAIRYMGEMDGFVKGNVKYNVFGECALQDRRERIIRSIKEFFPYNVSGLESFFGWNFVFSRPIKGLREQVADLAKGIAVPEIEDDMFSRGCEVDDWLEVASRKGGAVNTIKYLALSVYHAIKDGSRRPVGRRMIEGLDKKIAFLNNLEQKAHAYLGFNERYVPFCEETIETLSKTKGFKDPNYDLSRMFLKVRGLKRDADSLQKLLRVIGMCREGCIERKTRVEKIIK